MPVRLLALLAAVAVAAVACSSADAGEPIPGVRPGVTLPEPADRDPAPTDAVEVLGEDRTLSVPDFAGKVLVVNFWASWCGPCRREQPDLNEVHGRLAGDDVAFLGVNIQDTVPNAQAHEREFDIPYPSLFDPSNAYAARYGGVGPRSIPTTIIIDRQGRVAVRLFGITNTTELLAATTAVAEQGRAMADIPVPAAVTAR